MLPSTPALEKPSANILERHRLAGSSSAGNEPMAISEAKIEKFLLGTFSYENDKFVFVSGHSTRLAFKARRPLVPAAQHFLPRPLGRTT